MRKNITAMMLAIAAIGVTGCSDKLAEEATPVGNGNNDRFVVFNINTVGNETRATRATPSDSEFDTGEEYEYKITPTIGANVVFFFDKNNNFVSQANLQIMKGDSEDVEHDGHGPAGTDDTYKEKFLKARIVGDTDNGDIESCVMILNADPYELNKFEIYTGDGLDKFMKLTQKLNSGATENRLGRYDNYFTMSNTVYLKDGVIQGPVGMKDKIYASIDEAEANPIRVHVERVSAKFSLTFNNSNGNSILNGNTSIYDPTQGGSNLLSVRSNGSTASTKWGIRVNNWDINATETETYWVKNLYDGNNFSNAASSSYYGGTMSPTDFGKWAATTDAGDGEQGWNDDYRLRSYWAVDPHYNEADGTSAENYPQQYRKADDNTDVVYMDETISDNPAKGKAVLSYISYNNIGNSIDAATYAPENTFAYNWFEKSDNAGFDYKGNDYKRTSTHILVAAELLLGSELDGGEVADKYCYGNIYWADKNELVTYMVNAVLTYGSFNLYKSSAGTDQFDAEKDANDYFDLEKPATIEGGDGKVMITLKDGKTLYLENGNAITDKDLEHAVLLVGTAKHFKNGKMYYYIPIKHIAATTNKDDTEYYKVGSYGVVRNHWYKINVSGISAPGISVDDPDQPIIPNEDPEEGAYASFEIVIVPWHVIDVDVTL